MPWTHRHRWIAFLMFVAVFALGISAGVVMSRNYVGGELSVAERNLLGVCLIVATVAVGFARQEHIARKVKHDLAGNQNLINLHVQAAEKAVEELPERVARTINGGLERAVEKKLNESALPTTPEELQKFAADVSAATVEKLKADGLLKSDDKPRVQT